ncbi:hypothetical protein [Streptomonospora litoralis]|uniref:Uncharacterized protein n=1 Tax=Streptomonospora litoralis TaxID=2498135 RepID=A0A4P6PZA6_9ACTN|nr:hypothetical protein [Streptomonospora litoralis]QBI53473.1 hypothetical protein EKD16_08395 [Streptomonospora litoralis]
MALTFDPRRLDPKAPMRVAPRDCHLLVITNCDNTTAVHSHADPDQVAAALADITADAYVRLDAGPLHVPPAFADQLRAAGWTPPAHHESGASE